MKKKNKFLTIFMFLFVMLVSFQLLGSVSAAKNDKIDDSGVAPIKNLNITKLNTSKIHWKVHGSNKELKIFKYYSKGNYKTDVKKFVIKRISRNQLKVIFNNKNNKVNKYVKTNYNLKSYYLKVYKPKMLKNAVINGYFDRCHVTGVLKENSIFNVSWKAKIKKGNIIITEKNVDIAFGNNYTQIIFIKKSVIIN